MKIIFVDKKPSSFERGDHFIDAPNFLSEIALHKNKASKNNITGAYHLRMIADSIAQKYDPENMSAFSVKTHLFEGRPFNTDEELNTIIMEMMQLCHPKVFAKFVEYSIKNRPVTAKRLIFMKSMLSDGLVETICIRDGIIVTADEDTQTTNESQKPKKIVGKPAITKEQAEQLKKQNVQN